MNLSRQISTQSAWLQPWFSWSQVDVSWESAKKTSPICERLSPCWGLGLVEVTSVRQSAGSLGGRSALWWGTWIQGSVGGRTCLQGAEYKNSDFEKKSTDKKCFGRGLWWLWGTFFLTLIKQTTKISSVVDLHPDTEDIWFSLCSLCSCPQERQKNNSADHNVA